MTTMRLRLADLCRLRCAVVLVAVFSLGLPPPLQAQAEPKAQTQTQVQNVCTTGASPINPLLASLRSDPGTDGGIGGTGISTARAKLGGIGGTGGIGGIGGTGGTGVQARAPDPGGAETGQGGVGGTGIVGVITGFASICVNGVEVHFDATTPVSDAGETVSARQLTIGQLVAVSASGTGAQVQARRIALIHTAVGPLETLDARTGSFSLLGQSGRVRGAAGLDNLMVGDWVRVSGQRLVGGTIVASRLDRIAPQKQVQLNGVVTRVDTGSFYVGDAQVKFDFMHASAPPAVGSEITVTGSWDGRVLLAQQAIAEPTRKGLGAVSQVVLAGYVQSIGQGRLSLGLGDLRMNPDAQVVGASGGKLALDQHVQVTGHLDADQRVTVDRVVVGEGPADGVGSGGASRSSGRRGGREARDGEDRSGRSGSSERTDTSGRSDNHSGSGDSGSSGGEGGSGSSGSSGGESGSGGSGSSGGEGGSEGSGSSGGEGSESGGGGHGK